MALDCIGGDPVDNSQSTSVKGAARAERPDLRVQETRSPCHGQIRTALSHDGVLGRLEAEPLFLSLQPADGAGYPSFHMFALPQSSARVLKAQVRARCRALVDVKDDHIRLLFRGVELPDNRPISQHVLTDSRDIIEITFMVLRMKEPLSALAPGLYLSPGVACDDALGEIIAECNQGLQADVEPMLTSGGTGGTYILRRDDFKSLAVFKPKDEEVGGPQNPRGYAGEENSHSIHGVKTGVRSAHRAVREVAAYALDRGFAGVPMTTLAHGRHPALMPLRGEGDIVWKVGSLQAFVQTTETADNFGCQVYSASDVHRIGILDVRIVNFDRNYGNILVKVGSASDGSRSLKLVPIDHGCSLPDRLELVQADMVWMSWPQAKQLFGDEELRYIESLDGAADARCLNESLGLERDGLRLLEVSTLWLQLGAAHGLTLYDIGLGLCRDANSPSAVENVIASAIFTATIAAHTPLEKSSTAAPGYQHPQESKAASQSISSAADNTVQTSSIAAQQPSGQVPSGSDQSRLATSKGIFCGQDVQWTDRMEIVFRKHVSDALNDLAQSRSEAAVSCAPSATAENTKQCSDVEASSQLVALPRPSAKAYIPPHLRRKLEAERAAGEASGEVDSLDYTTARQ